MGEPWISPICSTAQGLGTSISSISASTDERSVRFTVPTVLGSTAVIEIVQFIYDTALYAARPGSSRSPDKLVDAWPEYVIGPRNPLTFLEPSMDCSFFSA